ncbi:MAG: site-2 protease family protein [Chloroflexi bacterium]|nr:site-2 protease family protein [Chloroflexota bacterium]
MYGRDLIFMLYMLVSLVLSITVHEFFHAWMANYLGDSTAKRMGRVSLNPLVHLDPMGSVMMLMAVYSGIGLGWGKPVPVNPYNTRRDPRTAMGIIGAMGPVSNLILATVVAMPLRFGTLTSGVAYEFLYVLASVNISLAAFNLLPFPPLDGYSVLMAILNLIRKPWAYRAFQTLARLEAHGPMLLLLLIMADSFMPFSLMGLLIGPPIRLFSKLVLGI